MQGYMAKRNELIELIEANVTTFVNFDMSIDHLKMNCWQCNGKRVVLNFESKYEV